MTFTGRDRVALICSICLFFVLVAMCLCVARGSFKEFSLTLISTALLLGLLLSIRNRFLRTVLVDLFFIFSAASFFAREVYSYISKDMILATVGVDWHVSIGLVQTIDEKYVVAFFGFILLVSALAYRAYVFIPGRLKFLLLPLPLIVSLLEPVRLNWLSQGPRNFVINNVYSPAFMAQDYLDLYRIFWGDAVAATMIGVEQFADRVKYFRIPHPTFPNFVTKVADGDEKVIFVIGEASNVKRYSAYGYDVPTTPNLDAMLKNGDICVVQKVHSSTPTTRTSVPMYVSFATPQNRDFLFAYKNIIEMASLNGYRTYWIGSQTLDTLWDKTYGFVAKYADVLATPSANTTKFAINSTKDDDLIAPIHFYFRNAAKKSFFIIHLSGNHLSYDRNLDPEDKAALPDADDYDKSVHHVDRTLRDIKEEADRDFHDYKLVYLPDHGEAVNYGHGFSTKFNEMYLIPLLTNSRDSCDEMERMRGVDGYVPGQAVKYLILKLLGYQIDDSAIRDTQRHSFEVLTGDEQIIDFRNLAACESKDCPD